MTSGDNENRTDGKVKPKTALSAKWLFDAAMLSSPIDLSALVAMSRDTPEAIVREIGLLARMVDVVLNGKSPRRVDKEARLDAVKILGNLALTSDTAAKTAVRAALQGVSAWFEEYMSEEGVELEVVSELRSLGAPISPDPELHKAMLVLLCRAYDYNLKTEDLLELTQGDRRLALETVTGLLEDGEAITTAVAQRERANENQRGVWEKIVVVSRWERSLVAQACALLRGFTHPTTYFKAMDEGFYFLECGVELPEYCIEQFSLEMHGLLAVAMRDELVEKLAFSLHEALFLGDARVLSCTEHAAVLSAHEFFQNLYLYGGGGGGPLDQNGCLAELYRSHLICETLLIPHLVLPYLERCIYHASVLHRRHAQSREALSILGPECSELINTVTSSDFDDPALTKGIAATLRTLVIATFRAPRTRVMFQILQRFNPTAALLEMRGFVQRHEYIFTLLLQLNVNMGSFDVSRDAMRASLSTVYASFALLQDVAECYQGLDDAKKRRVLRRLERSGALPVARDEPSYTALLNMLWGGGAGQFEYLASAHDEAAAMVERRLRDVGLAPSPRADEDEDDFGETACFADLRAEAKRLSLERQESLAHGGDSLEINDSRASLDCGRPSLDCDSSEDDAGGDAVGDEFDEFDDSRSGGVGTLTCTLEQDLCEDLQRGRLARDDLVESEPPSVQQGDVFPAGAAAAQARRSKKKKPPVKEGAAPRKACDDGASVLRLLGDLPTLDNRTRANYAGAATASDEARAVAVALELEVPKAMLQLAAGSRAREKLGYIPSARGPMSPTSCRPVEDDAVPKRLTCAINGHLMRDPVRARDQRGAPSFERETIELWLATRGSVCPITGKPLVKADLESHTPLRNEIVRYHIQRTAKRETKKVKAPKRQAPAGDEFDEFADVLAEAEAAIDDDDERDDDDDDGEDIYDF